MKYFGLTDDPRKARADHANPVDWWEGEFETAEQAYVWEQVMSSRPGYTVGPKGQGWKWGYVYTITDDTKQGPLVETK